MYPRCFVLAAALATSATATATAAEWKHYVGTINGNVPITADLRFDDTGVSGVYRYNRVGTAIPLQFKARTSPPEAMSSWTLEEFGEPDSGRKPTGVWSLQLEMDWSTLQGTWTSPDGATSFPLVLRENYVGAAHVGEASLSADGEDEGWTAHVTLLFPTEPAAAFTAFRQSSEAQLLKGGFFDRIPDRNELCEELKLLPMGERSGDQLLYNGDGVLSVGTDSLSYSCGQKSFLDQTFRSIDLATGRTLQWYDFVRPEGEALLNRLLPEGSVRDLGPPGVDGHGIWFAAEMSDLEHYSVHIPWKDLAGYTTGHPITR